MRADINQAEIVDKLRLIGASVLILSQVGNGAPDLLVGFCKKNHLFEIKNPDTKYKLSTEQIIFNDKWKGAEVKVIKSWQEAYNHLGITF